MKIIDIGKVIDNKDPLGIGRIRFSRYNDYTGEVERALNYVAWDEKDIFVANPFLPNNINFIPEIGQSVKIINYNTTKDKVNTEYIAGPFNTMFDYNGQTFSQQVTHTTYGTVNKRKPNIFDVDGKYVDKKTENAFANEKDFAVYGKSGSDLLFTENGLVLRGGKLLSKEAASIVNREKLIDYPLMSKKSSKLFLKKFPKKMILTEKLVKKSEIVSKKLNYIVEYTCLNSTSPSHLNELYADVTNMMQINFYVYRVLDDYGDKFQTKNFNNKTQYSSTSVKLINLDGTDTTPTHIVYVPTMTAAYLEIRHILYEIHGWGLKKINPQYDINDIHPFYFKPTDEFESRFYSETGSTTNRAYILNSVNVCRVGPNHGLIWDQETATPPAPIETEEIINSPTIISDSPEQTFGALITDKFYLLSSDLGESEQSTKVPFEELSNEYELTQEDYIQKIDPATFSTVRGENLVKILNAIIEVIYSHKHNPLMPISGQPDYVEGNALKNLVKTLEKDILNKSIRIN